MNSQQVVLDTVDNIVVSREQHHNNLSVLRSLHVGLFHLAEFVRRREMEELPNQDRTRVQFSIDFGNNMELLLAPIFDWFAVSLISYLRTIKLMEFLEEFEGRLEPLKEKRNKTRLKAAIRPYLASVAPDVLEWRNKIAAHRSATDPQSDSLAMMTYSTIPPVGYQTPYFGVGHLAINLGDGSSANLPQWSLTQKYEELVPRFWPDQELTKFDW